jgi:hypothetical protein
MGWINLVRTEQNWVLVSTVIKFKGEKFLEQLKTCYLIDKNTAAWK